MFSYPRGVTREERKQIQGLPATAIFETQDALIKRIKGLNSTGFFSMRSTILTEEEFENLQRNNLIGALIETH